MSHVNIRLTVCPPALCCLTFQPALYVMHRQCYPLVSVCLCQIELISLTCYPQVLRCFREWVPHGGTSLKALFVKSVGA